MQTGVPVVALLWFPVLLAVATAAGSQLLRWARTSAATPLEEFVFAAATGFGVLSYALLAAGLLGAFNRAAFFLLLLAFALLGAPRIAQIARARRQRRGSEPPQAGRARGPAPTVGAGPRACPFAWIAAAAGIYLAGATLLAALAPPGGNDWDGLAYHLAAPKIYLIHGRIHFIPYDSHTNFPFTMEMLYGLGLALGGAPLAKLFHWAAGGLTALAVAAFCGANLRRGEASLPRWAPPLAAVLFLAVPQVAWEATTAYIDLGTALFQFLALYALINGISRWNDAAGKRPSAAWWLIAGGMSGWAMGTKYTALLPFGLLLLAAAAWAWTVSRREGRASPFARAWCLMALLGVVVASPWYIKNVLWTHNPVYPFFYRWFPRSVNWTREAEDAYRMEQQSFGMGHTAAGLVVAPWNTAMEGAAFWTVASQNARTDSLQRYLGTVLGSVGVAFLGLAPLWPFAGRVSRRAAWLLAYVGANFVAWFFLSQQTRYLLPILAPAGIVGVAVMASLPHGFLRVAAGCFIGVSLLVNLVAIQGLALAPSLPVVLGRESPDAYLSRTLPDLYPALQFVNTLPNNARVAFYQEVRGFYSDREYFWANPLQHTLIPYESLPDGTALTRFLRQRLGITHVLINQNFMRGSEQTAWYRLLQDASRRGALALLYDARGVVVFEIR